MQGTDRLGYAAELCRRVSFRCRTRAPCWSPALCQARPGQRWLDVCAAPGGKTTHLAQLMLDTGQIVALDLQAGRVRLLHHNIRRSTLVEALQRSSRMPPVLRPYAGCAMVFLIDAPCSGFGVLRRHPDIKWRKTASDLVALQAVQLKLLHIQQAWLAAHGVLVYSVCSNEPEETHEVVQRFLADTSTYAA